MPALRTRLPRSGRASSKIPRADFVQAPFGLLALAIGTLILARRYGARLSRAAAGGIDWRSLRYAGDGWLSRTTTGARNV